MIDDDGAQHGPGLGCLKGTGARKRQGIGSPRAGEKIRAGMKRPGGGLAGR